MERADDVPVINLTIDQTVRASKIGRTTVFALIKSGELESIKVGRRRYVPLAALNDYLNRLRSEQNAAGAEQYAEDVAA